MVVRVSPKTGRKAVEVMVSLSIQQRVGGVSTLPSTTGCDACDADADADDVFARRRFEGGSSVDIEEVPIVPDTSTSPDVLVSANGIVIG